MSGQATMLLEQVRAGDAGAAEKLLPLIYAELRALAGSYFRDQPGHHTLQPTALVHEAYLRLIQQPADAWQTRAHFFAVAATAMRQILTDFARRRNAQKRGGGAARVALDVVNPAAAPEYDPSELDELLTMLARHDARKARVVELRFFGGLEMKEIAEVLNVSLSTVEADWRAARAFLAAKLRPAEKPDAPGTAP
jgi:RNA polymerase sigma factor (TIGR02999 family)